MLMRSITAVALGLGSLLSVSVPLHGAENSIGSSPDGVYSVEELSLSMKAPAGWEVKNSPGNVSLILQEPKPSFSSKNSAEVIFQRNITVAVVHKSAPMDEIRLKEFTKELEERFSQNAVQNFRVLEAQIVDFKGKKDAVVAYTAMNYGNHPMMQLHVLTSGEDKQFLMTFTDLEKRFLEDKATRQIVWDSMMSLSIKGYAPSRYTDLIGGTAVVSAFLLILLALTIHRMRSFKRKLENEDDENDVEGDFSSHNDALSPASEIFGSRGKDSYNSPEPGLELTNVRALAKNARKNSADKIATESTDDHIEDQENDMSAFQVKKAKRSFFNFAFKRNAKHNDWELDSDEDSTPLTSEMVSIM